MAARCITRSCSRLSGTTTSSAAQAFVQLAPRKCIQNTPPVLDFLLPSVPVTAFRYGWVKRPTSRRQFLQTRTFASSARQQQTKAIFNPRKDDNGEVINIEILPGAVEKLKELTTQYSNPNLALRIIVESGGCHGFQYFTSLTTLPSPLKVTSIQEASPALNTSSSDPDAMPSALLAGVEPLTEKETAIKLDEDDTVFAANGSPNARVVVDGSSLDLLKNIKVDFTDELMGSEFKIVENPFATTSCGCGVSFDVKF